VQGAVDYELQPLLDALEGRRSRQISAWTFWEGRIGAKQVVVSRTEVGPINAVAATVLGIEHYQPSLIINHGTAGAHNPATVMGHRGWGTNRGLRCLHFGSC
jgi:adenosylhomocysteine nucleosidase